MKHIKLVPVFILLLVFAVSCNKTPHDKMLGKWDVAKIVNSTMTEQEDIAFFNDMNKNILDNELYTFTNEKITRTLPEKIEGTWEIDEQGTVLSIDWGESDINSPHNFVIKKLTSDSLIIEEDFEEFLMTTYFIKK